MIFFNPRTAIPNLAAMLSVILLAACFWATGASATRFILEGHTSPAVTALARAIPSFRMYFYGKTIPGHSNELRLTRIVILGTQTGEHVTVECEYCRGATLDSSVARGSKLVYPSVRLTMTTRSRLLVEVTKAGLVGRFKEYTLHPQLRSTRLVHQGCLAIGVYQHISCSALGGVDRLVGPNTATTAPPSCPNNPCLAVSRTTGYQVGVGGLTNISTVSQGGFIVAWQLALGSPATEQISFFDANEGGPAEAGLAILRPQPSLNLTYKLIARSPLIQLQPYFGTTTQFSLASALRVEPGDAIALTVPTWAPALAVGFGNETSWRASRPKSGCTTTGTQTSQTQIRSLVQYFCLYQTAVLTYSATLSPNV
jgi:hypothetical protein